MQGVDQEFVFVLAGSFFCAFLAVVAIGGAFLLIRLRQQERSGTPAPEPPVMTRDEHASPPPEYRPPAQADPRINPATAPAAPQTRPPMQLQPALLTLIAPQHPHLLLIGTVVSELALLDSVLIKEYLLCHF